jgi:hypothetical protein
MPPPGRSDPGHGSGPARYPGTFLLAFREAARELKWEVRRWLGAAVECADAEGREHQVGLENLYRRARRVDRAEWPALIVDFLRTAGSIQEDDGLPTDLAAVAEQLLVRLGQPPRSLPDDAKVWTQMLDATGLCLNLVVDYPNRMFYVTEKLVSESGRPGSAWLEQALANLRARTPEDCFEVVFEESGMLSCNVSDAYDSSRALLLHMLMPDTPADGCFVALPGRDHLLVQPVTLDGLTNVHLLKVLADKNYRSTPYPISDQVFWVRDGVWRVFPIEIQGEKVTVQPPEEFVEILRRLVPDEPIGGDDQPPSAASEGPQQ